MKSISLLLNGYVISLMTGCVTTKSTAEYCVTVLEEEECPSVSEVNGTTFPVEVCGGIHSKATEYTVREDSISVWEEDTAADAEFDSCCYETEFRTPSVETCVEGRPLQQKGEMLLADVVDCESDWSEDVMVREANRIVGLFWKRSAQYEHSSIAAFHICAVELLHFGAPAQLVARVQEATQDELHHATSAFRLASSFLGGALHPESFPIPVIPQRSLVDFALEIAKEGAINETLAVVLAAQQRKEAVDPETQEHLDMVIRDESQHALLAWDILVWAISVEGAQLSSQLSLLFQERPVFSLSSFPEQGNIELGILSRTEAEATVNKAWDELIINIIDELPNIKVA
jgi:hypothetical protein